MIFGQTKVFNGFCECGRPFDNRGRCPKCSKQAHNNSAPTEKQSLFPLQAKPAPNKDEETKRKIAEFIHAQGECPTSAVVIFGLTVLGISSGARRAQEVRGDQRYGVYRMIEAIQDIKHPNSKEDWYTTNKEEGEK